MTLKDDYLPGLEPAAETVCPSPVSIADLRERTMANPARTDVDKKMTISCLVTLGTMLANEAARRAGRYSRLDEREIDLSKISCAVPDVNSLLPGWSRSRTGLSSASYNNVIYKYRHAMVDLGLAEPHKCPPPPADSEWGRFFGSFERQHVLPVVRLGWWARQRDIAPEAISTILHRPQFAAFVFDRVVNHGGQAFIEAAFERHDRLLDALAQGTPERPSLVRRLVSVPTQNFLPDTVQAELDNIRSMMNGTDRDRPRRRSEARLLEENTIIGYMSWVRRFAEYCLEGADDHASAGVREWFLGTQIYDFLLLIYNRDRDLAAAKCGVAKESLPERVGKSSKPAQCGAALVWVAKYYLKLAPARLAELDDEISAYRPRRSNVIHPGVRARLDALAEPARRMRLLWLPKKLFKLARKLLNPRNGPSDPIGAAQLAMTGLAIAIELRCPLRADNLRTLQLQFNVIFERQRCRKVVKLMIPPDDTKGDQLYEWYIGDDTVALLDEYLSTFRPLLQQGSHWLFPDLNGREGACSMGQLRSFVVRAIDENVGVEVHLHLFRHFAVCLRLEDGTYNRAELRMLLGHRTFGTTERYYAYIMPKLAAPRHENSLMRAMRAVPPEIQRWLEGKASP